MSGFVITSTFMRAGAEPFYWTGDTEKPWHRERAHAYVFEDRNDANAVLAELGEFYFGGAALQVARADA